MINTQPRRPDRLPGGHRRPEAPKIGALGLDVYENERDLFFEDKSNDVIQDDVFRRLSACHNVLFTGHQAFPHRRGADQHFGDHSG